MKRKRFTEEQIIEVLWLHAAGTKPADLCRQQGISETTLYNWKARYGAARDGDPGMRWDGTLRLTRGSAPRPIAPPSHGSEQEQAQPRSEG